MASCHVCLPLQTSSLHLRHSRTIDPSIFEAHRITSSLSSYIVDLVLNHTFPSLYLPRFYPMIKIECLPCIRCVINYKHARVQIAKNDDERSHKCKDVGAQPQC